MAKRNHDYWTIVYRSLSSIEAASAIKTIWEILETSTRNNSRDHVTGFLVYDRGRFFQILEGAREDVKACYARIGLDTRHHHLETLIDKPVAARTFGRWGMGFVDAVELEDYVSLHAALLSRRPSDVFDALVRIGIADRLQ